MQTLVGFYSDLYRSRVDYTPTDLQDYLQDIEIPCLTDIQRSQLDGPIRIEELQEALSLFRNFKAPRDDGLPLELFKQYGSNILPHLLRVLNAARETQCLPTSMTRANIVLILKLGKDPLDPGSYRPISLLQSNIKILAKVLVILLNGVILGIIHSDQSGIMPQKSTAINLRRLFLNLQTGTDREGDRELLSLDAHKAFDSIEWQYLWVVMGKFGFGESFLSWVQLLYCSPQAVITEAGHISLPFQLHRGTRPGCPLSPLLFAIAIEPMAAQIRANTHIRGFQHAEIHEKLMLYADDTMLFLGDTEKSLSEAMSLIRRFGVYSGLVINWSKSSLMLLDADPDSGIQAVQGVQVARSFRYLGVQVTPEPRDFVSLNVSPLINRIRDRAKIWSRLKMSLAGRVNLIKMVFMPQLLYMLHNTPMVIPLKVFHIITTIFRAFTWLDKPPRIKLEQLQRSKERGGLALPNPWIYYLAAQLQHIARTMVTEQETAEGCAGFDPIRALMRHTTSTTDVAEGLEALTYAKSNKRFLTYVLMQKVWNKLRQLQNVYGFTSYSPIWTNGHYDELQLLGGGGRGAVTLLKHIFADGKLRPFSALREQFCLPHSMLFYYMQLRHAVAAQSSGAPWVLSPTPVFHYMEEVSLFRGFISR